MLCCLAIAGISYKSISDYVIQTNELRLKEGVMEISDNISKMDLMAQLVKQDTNFNVLTMKRGGLPEDQVLTLKYANQLLINISFMYSFSPYCFSLFQVNDLFISSSQCSYHFLDYYDRFMQLQDGGYLTPELIREKIFPESGESPIFWHVDSLEAFYGGKQQIIEDAVLCIITGSTEFVANSSYAMIFVISPETLINKLLSEEVRGEGFLRITGLKDGDTLLNYGKNVTALDSAAQGRPDGKIKKDGTTYHILNYQLENAGWEITIGLPQSIISNQTQPVITTLLILLGIGFLFVLFMTLTLSYRQYSNVKRLFSTVPGENRIPVSGQNEYDVLCRILNNISENRDEYRAKLDALSQQSQAIRLESLIVRGINTREEREDFERCFSRPLEFFCVALLRMNVQDSEDYHVALLCIVEYLRESCPNEFASVHTGANDELFLFSMNPADAPNVLNIKKLFENILYVLTDDMNITFNVALSAIGTDISNIHVCYNQARQVMQAYSREHENIVEAYNIEINSARENIVGMEYLDHLYNLLLGAERETIKQQFTKLINYYQKMPLQYETQKQQIFFSIRNVIYSACLHISSEMNERFELPNYKNYSMPEMAAVLEKSAMLFCDRVDDNKRSRNNELKKRILSYIEEHYPDSQLTASEVCRQTGISEKYLFQFIKEQTGETFSGYLERTRIKKAMDYLVETAYSNERIAELTGFASITTFYRAFNKKAGISPGTYRSSHCTLPPPPPR